MVSYTNRLKCHNFKKLVLISEEGKQYGKTAECVRSTRFHMRDLKVLIYTTQGDKRIQQSMEESKDYL